MVTVEDPLKRIEEIHEPDCRQKCFTGELQDYHAVLSQIELIESVPLDVRQLFETAKNLSLYSWFVYRFHQVSELVAFTALEMALRLKYEKENPNLKSPMLKGLLLHAKRNNWMRNEDFSNRERIAYRNAEMDKMFKLIDSVDLKDGECIEMAPPTTQEIDEALGSLDLVKGIVDHSAAIRNSLAHGSGSMHPTSIQTLEMNAEAINSVYR